MTEGIPKRIIKELIETAKIGDVTIFKTVLHFFCIENDNDISWVLISDKKGRSLMHIASMHGRLKIVGFIRRAICEATNDFELRKKYIDICDNKGRTALFYASAGGHDKVVNFLLTREADIEAFTNENHVAPGSTALMASAEKNHIDCVKLLLDASADIYAQRNDKADAFYISARNGNHKVLKLLMHYSDKLEPIIDRQTFHGRTAMFTASMHGHLEACKTLRSLGAGVKYSDNNNLNALFIACNEGHIEVVKWLIAQGAEMDTKAVDQALDAALANGHIQIFNLLILARDMLKNGGDREDVSNIQLEEIEKIRKLSRDDVIEAKNPIDEMQYIKWLANM